MSYLPSQSARQSGQRPLSVALAAGLGVAVVGALVWGLVIYLIKRDFSILAVGLGLAVGTVIARLRPGDIAAAVGSAVISLFGAVLGAIMAGVFIVVSSGVSLAATLGHLGPIISVVFRTEGFLGYLFWALAAIFGFRIPMQVARGRARAMPAQAFGPPAFGAPASGALGDGTPGFGAPASGAPGFGTPGFGAPGDAQSTPPMYLPPDYGSPQPPAQ